MKSVSAALNTHIGGQWTTLATCWKVTRTDGQQFFFTDHDKDLVVSGDTYKAAASYRRSAVQTTSEMSVDNLTLEGVLDSAEITDADLRAGLFDGAQVEIFLVNWADLSQGTIKLRKGHLGDVEAGEIDYRAELRGLAQTLQTTTGDLYAPDCRVDLGSTECGVNLASFTVTGSVTGVTDRRQFADSARTEADGHFTGGLLTWTSGLNNGLKREVKEYTLSGGAFELFLAMPYAIQTGDGYSVYAGCDKKLATCVAKFDNVLNFRGEPFVPGDDEVGHFPDAQ